MHHLGKSSGYLIRRNICFQAILLDQSIETDNPWVREDSQRDGLMRGLTECKRNDIVLLSGGVSAGVLDLVPACLRELGVEEVFHKVRVKPGKPLWFGVKQHPQGTRAVFGLPGNPVSSFVCFHLFTRVAIEQLAGVKSDPAKSVTARLTREYKHKGKRRTYYPASLSETAEGATVEPLSWYGSADLRHFADANALAIFPEGTRTYSDGEMIDVLPL